MKINVLLSGPMILAPPSLGFAEACEGITTQDMVACWARSLKTIDVELNTEYQRAMKVAKDQFRATDVENLKDSHLPGWLTGMRYARPSTALSVAQPVVKLFTSPA